MKTGIIVCGCNGSGKSTLGKELATALQYNFIDIEDCYFPKDNEGYAYDHARTLEEAKQILLEKVNGHSNFVLAAVKGNYGKEISALYRFAVLISVPKEIRMQRVWKRSFQKFGNRILPGGDLYEKEQRFFDMAAQRDEQDIEDWLNTTDCFIIKVDGTKAIDENVRFILNELSKRRIEGCELESKLC